MYMHSSAAFQELAVILGNFFCILKVAASKRLHMFLTIFESQSDLLSQRAACPREPVAASEGPRLRMGHFSSGAPPSLAFQPATQSAEIQFWDG